MFLQQQHTILSAFLVFLEHFLVQHFKTCYSDCARKLALRMSASYLWDYFLSGSDDPVNSEVS